VDPWPRPCGQNPTLQSQPISTSAYVFTW
jgi:hypothetical protein